VAEKREKVTKNPVLFISGLFPVIFNHELNRDETRIFIWQIPEEGKYGSE
jgi:hypothetical protein